MRPKKELPAKKKATTTGTGPANKGLSPRLRRAVSAVVSTVTALLVLGLAATVLAAGLAREAPSAQPVSAAEVEVGAGPLSLVCTDTPRLITDADGTDIDYDAQFGPSPEGVAASTEVLVLGRDGQDPGHADYRVLPSDEVDDLNRLGSVAVQDYPGAEAPGVLTAEPSQGQSAFGVGTAVARADAGDLRGLSVAPCQVPSSTLWLVGGSTELGSSARLTLTNPGQTPVTATVNVWGATGPVEGSATVLVAPGSARVVLLETLSLEERMAVRVTSDGGRLTAAIQDSSLRGVVPAGTDMVTATADPTTDLHVGPFLAPGPDEEGPAPVLRLVNPGTEETQVSVGLLGDDGPNELSGAQDQVLEPGTVTDISLAGIPAGPVALLVRSDSPVTGSVLLTRIGEAGELDPGEPVRDRAWVGAQTPQRHALLALPAGQQQIEGTEVSLANPLPTDQAIEVRAVAADGTLGEPVDLEMTASSSQLLAVEDLGVSDPVALELTGEALLATATMTAQAEDGELISVLAATPDGNLDQFVTVRLGAS